MIPIVVVLLLGAAATFYLQKIRLPREETVAGITALAGMRWRDYIHLVLAALNRRGYERVFESDTTSDESDYMLDRGGQAWLLSSKYGTAYVLGSTAIAEFANTIRMRGAVGGLLVTSGQFAPEANSLAAAQRIELLDGPALWPELKPLLPEAQREAMFAPAQARAKRHVAMSWLASFVIGLLSFMLLHQHAPDAVAGSEPTIPAAGSAAAPVMPARRGSMGDIAQAPTDPALLEQRRNAVAKAISTLPDVDRAVWSTQSTLLVYLLDEQGEPKDEICPLLEQYVELAASRIQLAPPPDGTRPVRFVQCRAF